MHILYLPGIFSVMSFYFLCTDVVNRVFLHKLGCTASDPGFFNTLFIVICIDRYIDGLRVSSYEYELQPL